MRILVAIHSPVAAWNIPDHHVERLRRDFPSHDILHVRDAAQVAAAIEEAEVGFMSELPAAAFARAGRLRWVHSPAAGVGGMLHPAFRDSPVVLTNSRAMSAETIAEHVIALTLALFRKLPLAWRCQLDRRWAQDETMYDPPLRTIRGSRAVVIGLGGIGAATATRFSALGATVTGVRRRLDAPPPEGVADIVSSAALADVLPRADVVVVAAAQTGETRGLISREMIARMNETAVLINVSRGKLVDEAALADALAQGRLGGAGLDVFEHEPLDPASPLWTLPNVLITPHVAAARGDHWDAATALFADNLRRFERGEPLLNLVDKVAGY